LVPGLAQCGQISPHCRLADLERLGEIAYRRRCALIHSLLQQADKPGLAPSHPPGHSFILRSGHRPRYSHILFFVQWAAGRCVSAGEAHRDNVRALIADRSRDCPVRRDVLQKRMLKIAVGDLGRPLLQEIIGMGDEFLSMRVAGGTQDTVASLVHSEGLISPIQRLALQVVQDLDNVASGAVQVTLSQQYAGQTCERLHCPIVLPQLSSQLQRPSVGMGSVRQVAETSQGVSEVGQRITAHRAITELFGYEQCALSPLTSSFVITHPVKEQGQVG
jgi:hypothetical protein